MSCINHNTQTHVNTKTHISITLFLIDNLIERFTRYYTTTTHVANETKRSTATHVEMLSRTINGDACANIEANHHRNIMDIDDEKEDDARASDCDTEMVPRCAICGKEIESTFLDERCEGFDCDHCDVIGACEKCVTTNIGTIDNETVIRLIVKCSCCSFDEDVLCYDLYEEEDDDEDDEDDDDADDDDEDSMLRDLDLDKSCGAGDEEDHTDEDDDDSMLRCSDLDDSVLRSKIIKLALFPGSGVVTCIDFRLLWVKIATNSSNLVYLVNFSDGWKMAALGGQPDGFPNLEKEIPVVTHVNNEAEHSESKDEELSYLPTMAKYQIDYSSSEEVPGHYDSVEAQAGWNK